MTRNTQNIRALAAGALLSLAVGGAFADDTELLPARALLRPPVLECSAFSESYPYPRVSNDRSPVVSGGVLTLICRTRLSFSR